MKLETSSTLPPSFKLGESQSGEVCSNINEAGRRRRLRFSIIQFVFAIIVLVVLMATGVDRLWRLPLFLLFAASAVSYFQWRDKTCVAFALSGIQDGVNGVEKMEDAAKLAQIHKQAWRVVMKGCIVALPLTLLAFILG